MKKYLFVLAAILLFSAESVFAMGKARSLPRIASVRTDFIVKTENVVAQDLETASFIIETVHHDGDSIRLDSWFGKSTVPRNLSVIVTFSPFPRADGVKPSWLYFVSPGGELVGGGAFCGNTGFCSITLSFKSALSSSATSSGYINTFQPSTGMGFVAKGISPGFYTLLVAYADGSSAAHSINLLNAQGLTNFGQPLLAD